MQNTIEEEKDHSNSFRDAISTVDKQGKRIWVYPKKPKGKYFNARVIVSIMLLAILFAGPFIRINGEPLLLLNILERKFVIFGNIFWPQDFVIFVFAMIAFIIFIVLFTVVYGRVFCGWVCPQTIFMEMVFRRIEYLIEGDYMAQKALNKAPWTAEKILQKGAKHAIFFVISFIIGNTFLAYIIGSDQLLKIITDPPSEHIGGLIAMLIFSGAFYLVFAHLREQVCTTVCPYGRFQGVLLDRNSVVVAYDYVRGETRGKYRKSEDRKAADKGDCIDCYQCVQVCPTGIDIRNGTQLECVNCTACIDACDSIMENVGLPKGLIRLDSEEGIANSRPFRFTARMVGYTFVLFLLIGVLVALLVSRSDTDTTILRTSGMLYQDQGDGKISNLYNVKIINKTNKDMTVDLKLENLEGEIKIVGDGLKTISKQEITEGALFLILDRKTIQQMKTDVKIGVYAGGELIETVETNFMGPAK